MTAPPPASVLGIIDWGVGGLDLAARLAVSAPNLPVVYWSDTGAPPYGTVPTARLVARLRLVIGHLADEGCTSVALACNAASTVIDRLGEMPVPVSGVIDAGIAAVPPDLIGLVGVVGGRRTIASGLYRRALTTPDRRVISRVAQPLSAHIEAGRVDGPEFMADLTPIVAPLRSADAVILACTHYPAAGRAFAQALPGVALIDPIATFARTLSDPVFGLARNTPVSPGNDRDSSPTRRYLTTGDPMAMQAAARAAWSQELGHVETATA